MRKLYIWSYALLASFCLMGTSVYAQGDDEDLLNDLLNENKEEEANKTELVRCYPTGRLVNGHSVETMQEGYLDFRISHRFGAINGGVNQFFGLDQANMKIGLEYGVTDKFTVALARSNSPKQYEGFLKYAILRQSTGKKPMPISLTAFSSMTIDVNKGNQTPYYFHTRVNYANQLLVARNFNDKFVVQLMPTLIHRNLVATADMTNNLLAMGTGLTYRFSKHFALTSEYYYVLDKAAAFGAMQNYDSFSIGVDIETGGHVFQLHITNASAMVENAFIGATGDNWFDGGIHFGFNISRLFVLK